MHVVGEIPVKFSFFFVVTELISVTGLIAVINILLNMGFDVYF